MRMRLAISKTLAFSALMISAATLTANAADKNTPQPQASANQTILRHIPERIQHFIDEHTVSGAVTLIAHHGEIVEFDAKGMADIEANRPMQKDTIFQIVSMTKPVTAIGIMMLAEEGKLALRDPVEQYLPEFRNQKVPTTVGPDAARLSS